MKRLLIPGTTIEFSEATSECWYSKVRLDGVGKDVWNHFQIVRSHGGNILGGKHKRCVKRVIVYIGVARTV